MPTIFTRIIEGEIPGTFVHEDDDCVVFMSINPMARGHALVVPREERDHWIDLSGPLVEHLFRVSHIVARAQKAAFECDKVGVIIAGYEVPHTHIHLIPTVSMSQLSFANAAASVDRSELEEAARRIIAALPAPDARPPDSTEGGSPRPRRSP
jgi:diadenosine tetraphosphate (Ap4A) HIT family hydrolase